MKTVLVDLLFYTGTRGGMESYVRQVYSRTSAVMDEVTFVGLASKELAAIGAPWFPGRLIDSGISSGNATRWALGEIFVTARVASRVKASLIHSPANIGPIFSRVPVILTIQDILSYRHPEYFSAVSGAILRWLIRAAAKNARRVLTISSGSATDISAYLKISPANVTIIPLAGSSSKDPAPAITDSRAAYPPMILSGGNRLPHKNFENLVRALAIIPRDRRPRLVITGGSTPDPLQLLVEALDLGEWVDLRGWIPADELADLYAEATVYVFPTQFEGFGLPVIEAMARGCPVICSDIPVLRDVAGDAAIFVDTLDPTALSAEIMALLTDPKRLSETRTKGISQAKKFSWEQTAQKTMQVFLET